MTKILALGAGLVLAAALPFESARPSTGFAAGAEGWQAPRDTLDIIPPSIREEHQEIRHALEGAARKPGEVGERARALAALMEPHFVKEEELALPPLAILPVLVAKEPLPEAAHIASLATRLEAELPTMLEEHKAIGAAAHELAVAAGAADRPEIEAFAEQLLHHARSEEEITYPAAIITGRYVRSCLVP
jgi:hypothetical protein